LAAFGLLRRLLGLWRDLFRLRRRRLIDRFRHDFGLTGDRLTGRDRFSRNRIVMVGASTLGSGGGGVAVSYSSPGSSRCTLLGGGAFSLGAVEPR
jgi:hypothetical protein